MAYTAWSVVYGEQPTAAKWNQLGANDAGFKDGTNIDNLAITYPKMNFAGMPSFLAYPSASQTLTGGGAAVPFQCNTELYDTANNYNNSTYVFTAPVTGVYEFFLFATGTNGTSSRLICGIKVNSTTYNGTQTTDTFSSGICQLTINLTAGDTVQPMISANPANIGTNSGIAGGRFSGKRVS